MKIGQFCFFRLSLAVGAPLRLGEVRLPLPGPARPDAVALVPELPPHLDLMALPGRSRVDRCSAAPVRRAAGWYAAGPRPACRSWSAAVSADRAAETAAELADATGGDVRGLSNADAAAARRRGRGRRAVGRSRRPARVARGAAGRQDRGRLRQPARLRQAGRLRARRWTRARPPSRRRRSLTGLDRRGRVPPRQRRPARRLPRSPRSTPTCWCSATTATRPTWSRALADAVARHAGRVRRSVAQRRPGRGPHANLISVNRRYKATRGSGSPTSESRGLDQRTRHRPPDSRKTDRCSAIGSCVGEVSAPD